MSKATKVIKHRLEKVASILKQVNQPDHKRYKVYIKKDYRKDGDPKTHRLFFRTETEARDWVIKRKCDFGLLKALTDNQIHDAKMALEILPESGFDSLEKAISFLVVQNAEKNAQSDKTIGELIEEKIDMHKRKQGGRGGSEETIKEVIHRGRNMLGKQFGDMRVCDFKNKHFKEWWESLGRSPQLLRVSKAVFGFCLKEYRGEDAIIKENPITEIIEERPKRIPSIFKPDEWRRLVLTAIETNDQECTKGNKFELLAYVTLGLWCGIRPGAELIHIKWEDVFMDDDDPDVYVDPFRKTKYSRRVKLPACAITLLQQCQKKDGLICKTSNFRKRWDTLREIAGVSSSQGVWKDDIMRHTFASMHYAKHQSQEAVRVQLGHVEEETLGYYVNHGKRSKEYAEEFWNFTPPSDSSTLRKQKLKMA
tara:strand:+ start:348 stop:1616 length:1269 start_codon:yes stop_codon:yes gene_type:complete